MEITSELINRIPYLFLHPMLYIGIILIILQYRRQISLERKLFSSRIHFLTSEVLTSLWYGLIGGLIASTLLISLGIVFHPMEMWVVWLITSVLVLFHVRFLCLSYSVGILGVIAGVVQLTPIYFLSSIPWLGPILGFFVNIHIPSLIAIVAILHLVEAILVKLEAGKQATPMFIETKRGKLVGGYHLQSFWILPLFLIVSLGDTEQGVQVSSQWWPLIGGATGISILPVPAMIGYTDLTSVYSPKEKSKLTSNYLFIYSIILLGLAFISEYAPYFQIASALFAALAHEGIRILGRKKEEQLPAKFIHPKDGLKVLSVIPGSLAEQMGIKAGEEIKKVNGTPVTNKWELYSALQKQPAFVKLEIVNLEGNAKFVQHSIYDGDHHQLGIILAPDDEAPYYIEVENVNLFQLIKQKFEKISRGA